MFQRSISISLSVCVALAILAASLVLLKPVSGAIASPRAELHVCATGCVYTNVQTAVDAASPGDVIKVAAGAYSGISARSGVTQVVYISKTITLQGGYTTSNWTTSDLVANPTTLDAHQQARVMYISGNITVTVEGLRITGGVPHQQAYGSDTGASGGGLYVLTATITLKDSVISTNTAGISYYLMSGGGVYLDHATAMLTNNQIISNTATGAGAGLYLRYSNATLSSNTISANKSGMDGGGLYLAYGSATLTGNTLTNNQAASVGGGLGIDNSAATLNGNIILSNTASVGGGLYLFRSPASLNRTLVLSNTAPDGSGVYLENSDAMFVNAVIANNVVSPPTCTTCYAVSIIGSSPRFLHTTLARNTGPAALYLTNGGGLSSNVALTNTIIVSHALGIKATAGNTATLNAVLWYHDTTIYSGGAIAATNAITGDPKFGLDGYHILSGSLAIDHGVNAGVTTDIDNQLRPNGLSPDLGADEWYPSSGKKVYLPLVIK